MSQYMNRPARRQAKQLAQTATVSLEQAGAYNVWHGRWQGEGKQRKQGFERAQSRCKVARDAGSTRATAGAPMCLHFAHGCCVQGTDCSFFHRPPVRRDVFDNTRDCFGREKWVSERGDMSGTGSFEKDQRTLYVGNIRTPASTMERTVRSHFAEWGDIERVHCLADKGAAFVTYRMRSSAEFAREAMLGQALGDGEILNVRWATEDPNPRMRSERIRAAKRDVRAANLRLKRKAPQQHQLEHTQSTSGSASGSASGTTSAAPTDVSATQTPPNQAHINTST